MSVSCKHFSYSMPWYYFLLSQFLMHVYQGLWNLHSEILVLIVILSKLKEIPEEEILVFLCRYRRLHHTFCLSPVDKELLLKLQQQFGVSYCSVNFWISRMKEDALSLHGFHQEFILSCFISQQEYPSTWKGSAPAPFRSTEKLKASVSALTSNVRSLWIQILRLCKLKHWLIQVLIFTSRNVEIAIRLSWLRIFVMTCVINFHLVDSWMR